MPSIRSRHRRGLTVTEVVVVATIAVIGLSLLALGVVHSREQSRRNECVNKLRQLGIALHNYTSSKFKCLPAASFNLADPHGDPLRESRPADDSGGRATTGYSWIVEILPHLEQNELYNAVSERSQRFTLKTGAFSPQIAARSPDEHAACVPLAALICPSWSGDQFTNDGTTIDVGPSAGAPRGWGAPEYANVDSSTPGRGARSRKGKVAPTNYKPIVGTHLRNGVPIENGGMIVTAVHGMHGVTDGAFTDGTSRTLLLAETRESGYASWYDGTLNWLVANDPNQPPPGTADKPPWTGAVSALNRGYDPKVLGSVPYLKGTLTANAPLNDVWWGPSSEHRGGIVNHLYADGCVIGITDEIDSELYLGLVTRAGSEPIDDVLTTP